MWVVVIDQGPRGVEVFGPFKSEKSAKEYSEQGLWHRDESAPLNSWSSKEGFRAKSAVCRVDEPI